VVVFLSLPVGVFLAFVRSMERSRHHSRPVAASIPLRIDCTDVSHGGCGRRQASSEFSLSLQHIRFDGAPLLCNTCAIAVPPSPQLSITTEQKKELHNAWIVRTVRMKAAERQRNHTSVLVAATSISVPSLFAPQPRQPQKRKKHSREREGTRTRRRQQ